MKVCQTAGAEAVHRHGFALEFPLQRKSLQQIIQLQLRRLPPIEDRFHDLRRQQREPQNSADVRRVHALRPGQVLHRRMHAGRPASSAIGTRAPAPSPSRCRPAAAAPTPPVRRHHQLPPAALPERQRYVDGDRLAVGRYRRPLHAAALLLPATSRTSPASPFGRSRTSTPCTAHRPARPAAARSAPARPGTARPQRVELQQRLPRPSSLTSSCSARAVRHVPTMISGCRKMPRRW